MAQLSASTYETYDAQGIREELSEQIFRISPEETPFVSNIGREGVDNTYFEWQNDALTAVDLSNNQIEGNDYTTFQNPTPTTRLGNYCQISAKTLIVSGTVDRVKKAGRKSELAYQLALRGAELKRDIESIAVQNQAATAGAANGGSNRKTAGFECFLRTNTSRGAGAGANPTLSGGTNGYPNLGPVAGTARAFTETLLKTVAASIWSNGGTLKMLMVGAAQKQVVSGFTGIAQARRESGNKPITIVGAADCYLSDFGDLQIVPSRFSRNASALFLDPDRAALVFLRPMAVTELAKTGDAEKRLLLAEWGLKVYHEGGHGVAADLL